MTRPKMPDTFRHFWSTPQQNWQKQKRLLFVLDKWIKKKAKKKENYFKRRLLEQLYLIEVIIKTQ